MTIKALTRIERAPGDIAGTVLPAGPAGAPGTNGANGTNGTDGANGVNGTNGWTPIFAIVSDSARRVLQVSDWTGGTSGKPASGQYVALSGLTSVLADAIDIRGPQGATGASGSGTGDMVASTYDTNADGIVNDADHAASADAVPWTGVSGKPTFATVATTGSYTDLTNKPSIGSGDMTKAVYDTTNNGKVDAAEAADSVPWTGVTGKPSFATVATSGLYADLSSKPTLGTAAAKDTGTTAGQVVEVQTGGKLPALDGSLLTNLPSASPPSTFASIGSYAYLKNNGVATVSAGSTASGANLADNGSPVGTGTWRAMCSVAADASGLFIRIA